MSRLQNVQGNGRAGDVRYKRGCRKSWSLRRHHCANALRLKVAVSAHSLMISNVFLDASYMRIPTQVARQRAVRRAAPQAVWTSPKLIHALKAVRRLPCTVNLQLPRTLERRSQERLHTRISAIMWYL